MISGMPRESVTAPPPVAAEAGGEPARLVWRNEVGGLTYEVGTGARRRFVKWAPAGSGLDLTGEAARLTWAATWITVPRVLGRGIDESGSWLVTAAIPGENAVADRWKADPATAATAIGEGLRALHDALPVAGCPFSWSVERRLAKADPSRADHLDPARWDPQHVSMGRDRALAVLAAPPPIDEYVVCHGDSCAPNTLITADGRWSGHVDLDALGVADRWADLAIATWSTTWNYGPGWERHVLDAYGIAPDPDRIIFYRLLWDLT